MDSSLKNLSGFNYNISSPGTYLGIDPTLIDRVYWDIIGLFFLPGQRHSDV